MIWVDYGILAVLLVSVIVGLVRGFAREVLQQLPMEFAVEAQKLQYTAPGEGGDVEVRNDRGQVQQAATSKLRQAASGAAPAPAAEAPRGAFGQRTDGAAASTPAPQNRADRRAAGKKK